MNTSLILLNILAAVCLLLWGTRMVRLGFTRAYGTSLRRAIATGTGNRLTAFFSGLGVTALLQSSTATILLLVSFAKKHAIPLTASLAVVIGADLSTTLVAQVLTFDLSWLPPALLIIGIIAHLKNEKSGRKVHLARIIIGLGLMLLALNLIRQASAPLQSAPTLPLILQPLQSDPALAVIVSALITWIFHSSLASVLLFASLAASNLISIELGILLVLGANVGGALVPLLATYKNGAEARRICFGNLIMRLFILLLCAPFLPEIIEWIAHLESSTARQIIHTHTLFNLVLALVFLPSAQVIAYLCNKAIADDKKKRSRTEPLYLDEQALDSPVMALAGAARETLRIAETIENMLVQTIDAFEKGDEKLIKKIRKADNEVDALYNEVKLYMTRLTQESLDPKEADRYIQILTYSTNLEHVGDIIDLSLMDMAEKAIEQKTSFSKEGFAEIQNFHTQVLQNMRMAQAVFMSEDPKLATHLVEGKEAIREAANKTSKEHFKRLENGKKASIETSALHLDIIRDLRRINSYITRVAFSIVETAQQHEQRRKD